MLMQWLLGSRDVQKTEIRFRQTWIQDSILQDQEQDQDPDIQDHDQDP